VISIACRRPGASNMASFRPKTPWSLLREDAKDWSIARLHITGIAGVPCFRGWPATRETLTKSPRKHVNLQDRHAFAVILVCANVLQINRESMAPKTAHSFLD